MSQITAAAFTTFETAAGLCSIAWNGNGISGFQLATDDPGDVERWRRRRVLQAVPGIPDQFVAGVVDMIKRYFAGEPIDFSGVAVDLSGQTEFFTRIYTALRRVSYGQTTTYGALAKELGVGPEMARDVGVAMSKNPIPLIIPCHRVLAAGGKAGGFSAPGGVENKIKMLELEGVQIKQPKAPKQPSTTQGSFEF